VAKKAAHGSRFWLDESPLSGYLTSSSLKVQQETVNVATFSDDGPRRVVGNFDHSGDWSGLFDAADGALDPVISVDGWTDEDHYLAHAFGSAAEADLIYERVIRLKERPLEAKGGQAILLNFTDEGSGALVRGRILRSAAVTGTGNGTGQNLGATTSGQLFVVTYRILAVSGSGSIVLQCQESQNDGSPDTYASISDLASGTLSAVGVTRKTTTSATEAWKRMSVTTFSGFTSVTVLVTAGLAAGS
jgi:hypothetical protein